MRIKRYLRHIISVFDDERIAERIEEFFAE